MTFTQAQRRVIERIKKRMEKGTKYNYALGKAVCRAFGGDPIWRLIGVGGSRFVIVHPKKEGYVLKMAFTWEGIEGNRDEYNTWHEAPNPLKECLGEVGELLEDGLILEMKRYEGLEGDENFDNYAAQYQEIAQMVRFVHYQDPPYYHSFGIDGSGKLMLIDYGETEHIEWTL